MPLRLNVLGGLSLTRAGKPMVGVAGQRKPLALLAVIERAGMRGITREKLMGYLVPESDETRARGVLKQLLYTLRRGSGADLTNGVSTLSLNGEVVQCDLRIFEERCAAGAWREAVDLYVGPYLDGVHLAGSAEFEEWIEQHRRSAGALYRNALKELALAGDAAVPGGGEGWWDRLCQVDPLDPQLVVGRMRSLVAAGRRSAAVQLSRAHEARVREALGIEADAIVLTARAEIERDATPVPLPPTNQARPSLAVATIRDDDRRDHPRSYRRWWLPVAFAGAVVLFGLTSITGAFRSGLAEKPSRPRNTVPITEVASFVNQTGSDSLAFLGSVIGDRIATALAARGIVQSQRTADRAVGAHRGPDVRISGQYFTSGDTLFIKTEVQAHGSRFSVIDLPLETGMLSTANHVVDTLVARVTDGITWELDGLRQQWAFEPGEHPDAGALIYLLIGSRSGRSGDVHCEDRLDLLDSAYAADTTLVEALIDQAEVASWCWIPDHGLDSSRLTAARKRLLRYQPEQPPFAAAYIDFVLQDDSTTRLHAARKMMAAAPASTRALDRLTRILAQHNQYREIIQVYEAFQAGHAGPVPEGAFAYADALHLAGRYDEELRVAEQWQDWDPTIGPSIRLRALAALHRTVDLTPIRKRLYSVTSTGPLLLTYMEELAAHANGSVADSVYQTFHGESCVTLDMPWARAGSSGIIKRIREAQGTEALERAQARQLESVERSLRYGCQDDASNGLLDFRFPVRDSVRFMAVKGELAASRGERAVAEDADEWLGEQDRPAGRRGRVEWYIGYRRARIAARLNNREQAFKLLSSALEGGMPVTMELHTDPLWRSFAADPMFRMVIGR